jgi:dolichol kinase
MRGRLLPPLRNNDPGPTLFLGRLLKVKYGLIDTTPQWHTNLVREFRRKLIHITGMSVPASILVFGRIYTSIMIAVALAVAFALEAGRLRGRINLPAVRDHEQEKVAGYIYYIFGSLVTVILFRPMIAVTAMLMLSLGDAVSGIVGSVLMNANVRAHNERWRFKPFPIVVSMFLACLAIGYFSSGITRLPWEVYLLGALGATVADSMALFVRNRGLDDNLTIPIFSGFMMSVSLAALA